MLPDRDDAIEKQAWNSRAWEQPESFPTRKLKLAEGVLDDLNAYTSPYDVFKLFFTEEIIESIVYHTNLYNNWRSLQPGGR